MRYDQPVYFQTNTPGAYDPSTGNYGDPGVQEIKKYASVMDTGTETMRIIYGEIRQGVLTIQLQNHYNEAFDQIRVGRRIYGVDYSRKLKTKHVFVISEVQ